MARLGIALALSLALFARARGRRYGFDPYGVRLALTRFLDLGEAIHDSFTSVHLSRCCASAAQVEHGPQVSWRAVLVVRLPSRPVLALLLISNSASWIMLPVSVTEMSRRTMLLSAVPRCYRGQLAVCSTQGGRLGLPADNIAWGC